jgi:hypothetical protein
LNFVFFTDSVSELYGQRTYQISQKSAPISARSCGQDGQTDMTELTVAVRKFANAPKNDNDRFMCF